MFYVTYPINYDAPIATLTFQDLINNYTPPTTEQNTQPRIITRIYDIPLRIPQSVRDLHNHKATVFTNLFGTVLNTHKNKNMAELYTTFQIPKHSGGTRTIQAPNNELKTHMRLMLDFLQEFLHPSQASYAYTRHKTIKNALESHQKKNYEWFLHLDLHDFFGSSHPEFVRNTLRKIPFFYYLPVEVLDNFVHFITLNNGLPQGTPLSPFITNLLMIPFDHAVSREITKHKGHYTRYADDMTISTTSKNATGHMLRIVRETLQEHTLYRLNEEKTKVTSIFGKNWNLGLMYNKDRQITIGHRNKERFRATIFEFCNNPTAWNSQSAMELLGKYQYYHGIEPTYFAELLTKYGIKFNMDVRAAIIQRIKEG